MLSDVCGDGTAGTLFSLFADSLAHGYSMRTYITDSCMPCAYAVLELNVKEWKSGESEWPEIFG
eukprot:1495770-Pleurochrysis_carterae.AAC.1